MIVDNQIKYHHIIIGIIISLAWVSLSIGDLVNAHLEYNVDGNGFHRTIKYKVNTEKFSQDNCFIALNVHLPSTLYVSIDELSDLKKTENITGCLIGETDIEIFAEEAKSQQLTICTRFNNGINILWFKLHQRYQRSRNDVKFVNITLPIPILLLGCKERIKEYPVSKKDICDPCAKFIYKWREIPYKMKTKSYEWVIPIGDLSQRNNVTWITLLMSAMGTILIVKSLWQKR